MDMSAFRLEMEKAVSDELYALIDGQIIEYLMDAGRIDEEKDLVKMIHQGNALPINSRLTPELYELCRDIQTTLEISDEIDFYILNSPEINAYAIHSRKQERPHTVVLHSGLIERFTFDELRFIIGHELGHLISGRIKLDDIISFLMPEEQKKDFPPAFLNKYNLWKNLTELTADRFGLIASGDMRVVATCFFKMTSGLNTSQVSFSPEAYLEENTVTFAYFQENNCPLLAHHPVNPIRIKALEFFAESELFRNFSEHKSTDTDDQKLHTRINEEIISIMMDLFEYKVQAHLTNFMITAGMFIAGTDGELTDVEMDAIITNVSESIFFPKDYIDSLLESENLEEVMQESIDKIMEEVPDMAQFLVDYLVGIAIADKHCTEEEIKAIMYIAHEKIGLSEKEAVRIIGNSIRTRFIPRGY